QRTLRECGKVDVLSRPSPALLTFQSVRLFSFIFPPIISQCFRKRFNRFITCHAFQNFEEDIRTILRCHIHNVMPVFDFYCISHRLSIPSLMCNIVKAHNSISSILSSTAAEVSRVITTPTTPLSALNPNSHLPCLLVDSLCSVHQ